MKDMNSKVKENIQDMKNQASSSFKDVKDNIK